ncbi:Uncharacterised protein [Mycobacterium tuberculosis]|nr:Uncharacterised protein [Mycobacterium tuberculosis]
MARADAESHKISDFDAILRLLAQGSQGSPRPASGLAAWAWDAQVVDEPIARQLGNLFQRAWFFE